MERKILCVCRGNTCRSPMFAAILQLKLQKLGRNFVVESAGYISFTKGWPAAKAWLDTKAETGIDLSQHRSRWIEDLNLKQYDIILTMDELATIAVNRLVLIPKKVQMVRPEYGGISDPICGGTDQYKDCYRAMYTAVDDLAPTL